MDARPHNLLLAALAPKEYEQVRSHLETVSLKSLAVLVEPGKPVDYVWFPENAVISVVRGVSDGTHIESAAHEEWDLAEPAT